MIYPTLVQVNTATFKQLANWERLLRAPGAGVAGLAAPETYDRVKTAEQAIFDRIKERIREELSAGEQSSANNVIAVDFKAKKRVSAAK